MGLLLGLALHNSVLVEPLFPLVFYKMLLTDMGDGNYLHLFGSLNANRAFLMIDYANAILLILQTIYAAK